MLNIKRSDKLKECLNCYIIAVMRLTRDVCSRDLVLGSAVSSNSHAADCFLENLIEGKTVSRKVISKRVVCPSCYLSYIGTVTGSLRALGIDCDAVDVGGYSGYAFVVNVTKGGTDASGPTALGNLWIQIFRATESLGLTIETYVDLEYEPKGRNPTPEELERAKKLFEKIRKEIDERDRPTVVWGLPVPDYGVAVGYEGDSYLANTIYGDTERPVAYHRIEAPGRIQVLFFREKVQKNYVTIDKEAVERAARFASWDESAPGGSVWVTGPAAFDTWVDALRNLPDIKDYWGGYGGNSYVAQCVRESRSICADFLLRLYKKYRGRQHKCLVKAAKCYEDELKLIEKFTQVFPYSWPPPTQIEVRAEDIKKGTEILNKMKPLEEEAVNCMKRAVEDWETH